MKKQMIFTALAVTAVLATACDTEKNSPATSNNAIEFRALIDKNVNSRASLVDNPSDLTNFFVAGGLASSPYDLDFIQTAVWRTGSAGSYAWNYAPNKYYPADGTAINFFAYAPIKDVNMSNDAELDIDATDGDVSFGYTVPNNQSASNTAVDLLVSEVTGKTNDNNAVAFEFNHALSGVTFTASNENPSTSELVYVVSGIEISALANEGTFTYPFSSTAWDPSTSLVTYTPGLSESGISLMPGSSSVKLLSANDIMMVLPQETAATGTINDDNGDGVPDDYNDASYVKVTFSLKDGSGNFIYNGNERYLPLPASFTFAPGNLYNFQFKFEASDAIEFNVTDLNGWTVAP